MRKPGLGSAWEAAHGIFKRPPAAQITAQHVTGAIPIPEPLSADTRQVRRRFLSGFEGRKVLHAIRQKKASLPSLFGAGDRRPLEDIVTSTVFGPLEFVCPDARAEVVRLFTEWLKITF